MTPDNMVERSSYGGKHFARQGLENGEHDFEHEEKEVSDAIEADVDELQSLLWRDMTKKTRAKLAV